MLALSRCENQSIIIDNQIEVRLVKWFKSTVRLSIQAPDQLSVDRDEVWRKLHPGAKTPMEIAEEERAAFLMVNALKTGDAVTIIRNGETVAATFGHRSSQPGHSIVLVNDKPIFVPNHVLHVMNGSRDERA